MTCCLNTEDYSPCVRYSINTCVALAVLTLAATIVISILAANNVIQLPPTGNMTTLIMLGVTGTMVFVLPATMLAIAGKKKPTIAVVNC